MAAVTAAAAGSVLRSGLDWRANIERYVRVRKSWSAASLSQGEFRSAEWSVPNIGVSHVEYTSFGSLDHASEVLNRTLRPGTWDDVFQLVSEYFPWIKDRN